MVINTNVSEPLTKNSGTEDEATTEYYEYDSYRFELNWRSNLLEEIKGDLASWIAYAKQMEAMPKDLTDKEKIEYLLKENQALVNNNELLKGCIMELADVVFA